MKTRPTVLESVGAIAIVILLILAIASWLLYALQVWCTYETEHERNRRIHPEWSAE